MLLIATDEAGYGPKLGPLVIAATAWHVPVQDASGDHLQDLFTGLRDTQTCDGVAVAVDDSKAIYKSGDSLDALHAAVSASNHWRGRSESTLTQLLPSLAESDLQSIQETSWLNQLSELPFLDPSATCEIRQTWSASGLRLLDVRARILTAARFNRACRSGANKAELLSESTIGLVHTLLRDHPSDTEVAVFCDRHGGRRYYAGVLQHQFTDGIVSVVSESKRQSVYRIEPDKSSSAPVVTVHFTVKGDSFTPVALSSIHAKYLRERFMESLNHYFQQRHRHETPLKPTAGYPVDADRFIGQIEPIIASQKIPIDHLVRTR